MTGEAHSAERRRERAGKRSLAALVFVLVALAALPAVADAAFRTGLAGRELQSRDAALRDQWFGKMARETGSKIVRLHLQWDGVVAQKPKNPRDPGDPGYFFNFIDAAVRDAKKHGLIPMIRISPPAPRYAAGPKPPRTVPASIWKLRKKAVGDFAHAVAKRYSGKFAGLPRVKYFQWWNEQNLGFTWQPLWKGKKPVGVRSYVSSLNVFYKQVKRVHRSNKVIVGGTAPHGDPRGGKRMRPLFWWREALCLKRNLKRKRKCAKKPRFDILAHHAVSILTNPPWRHAIHHDDIATNDMPRLVRALRAAERKNTVGGPRRHAVWVTELWWQTDPPDPAPRAVSVKKHARYLSDALYILWKAGTQVVMGLQLRDDSRDVDNAGFGPLQTGLYFVDGRAKPGLKAWRFPFVAVRASGGRTKVWGISPKKGRVRIERKTKSSWKRVASVKAGKRKVFTKKIKIGGRPVLRARIGNETSHPAKRRGKGRS